MIREIRYKISEDTKSIEPKTRQWAGMQYEDNATEVVFDISALGITNALCRIDFNSAGAGYQPSENLEFKDDCLRRAIPKHITQYGGEIQVTAVITVLDETGAVTGEALSWPVIVYLTAVDKSEEGSKEIETNISEIETSVRKAQEEVEETADKVAGMHHELQKVYLTADEIVEIKRDAEELIKDIETKLENGEFKGEKGDRGEKGEAGNDAITDQIYKPESENAQSGKAVADAVATKANLQFKEISVEGVYVLTDFIEGAHIYELSEVSSIGDIMYELYFTNGMSIRVEPNNYSFTIGKKYLIETHLDDNSGDYLIDVIAEVIDLEDKVNITDFEEALANVGGGSSGGTFVTIANITLEEAVNSITIDETTFPDILKVKDFYIALSIAKPEAVQSGNLLIKSKTTYAEPVVGVIKTWNHASYVMQGNFYSKYFDNNFRFNICAETLGANNVVGVNLTTTIAQILETLQAIKIQCATATSLIPAGSKITIKGYVGK